MDNRIKIVVKPQYVPERSDPVRSYYVFAYHITITNRGKHTFQLLSRYWHITDGQGNVEDIHGPGVVGKTPTLQPGESFEYTSFCPLKTEFGSMKGFYTFRNDLGEKLQSFIPEFCLIAPNMIN